MYLFSSLHASLSRLTRKVDRIRQDSVKENKKGNVMIISSAKATVSGDTVGKGQVMREKERGIDR